LNSAKINSSTQSETYLTLTEIKEFQGGTKIHIPIWGPLRSVHGLDQLHDPQYRFQENMPAFTTIVKLAGIENLRLYVDFHGTLCRMNLYVATALPYLSQVPHGPIRCTALPEIIEELQINGITREVSHKE
jgi:hypothetical protein